MDTKYIEDNVSVAEGTAQLSSPTYSYVYLHVSIDGRISIQCVDFVVFFIIIAIIVTFVVVIV